MASHLDRVDMGARERAFGGGPGEVCECCSAKVSQRSEGRVRLLLCPARGVLLFGGQIVAFVFPCHVVMLSFLYFSPQAIS